MMNSGATPQCHILVVDDEPLVREALQMLLEIDGHCVAKANSGPHALALFEPGKFDLVFTDYLMPAMKGDELAVAIKQRSPEQPIVMLTAYPEKLERLDEPLFGVDFIMGKPFAMENLRRAVARYSSVLKLDLRTV